MGSDLSISILIHLVQDSLHTWHLLPHTAKPIHQGKTCCVGPCTERQITRSLQWNLTAQLIQQGKNLLCGALHRKTHH